MGDRHQHLGIIYSIRSLDGQRWRWEIKPPDCVLGLRTEEGEVGGGADEAAKAARKAIERQIGRHQPGIG